MADARRRTTDAIALLPSRDHPHPPPLSHRAARGEGAGGQQRADQGPASVPAPAALRRRCLHGRPPRPPPALRPEPGPLLSHRRRSNRACAPDVRAERCTTSHSVAGEPDTTGHERPGSGAVGASRPGSSAAALSMPPSDHGRFAPTPRRAAPVPDLPPSADRFPDEKHPPRPYPDPPRPPLLPPRFDLAPPPVRPHATAHPEATTARSGPRQVPFTAPPSLLSSPLLSSPLLSPLSLQHPPQLRVLPVHVAMEPHLAALVH
jgi:hypothetical protein